MRGLAAIALAWLVACGGRDPYQCATSEQCLQGGAIGVCEASGFCSFADAACEGGQRYEPNAGNGLAGMCVPPRDAGVPDAGACGAVGLACCATGPACVGGATCGSGTCERCIEQVDFGRRFSCAVRTDGTVWCSGENNQGQLGIGVTGAPSATAMQVRDSTTALIADATAIGTGRDSACAIRAGGSVWCWGANGSGQLGTGTAAPAALATPVIKTDDTPLTNVVSVAGSENSTCARDSDGGIWCWGNNASGQLGDGTTTSRNKAAPVLIALGGAAFTGAVSLEVGGGHACARDGTDQAFCWGQGDDGQIGDGQEVNRLVPTLVGTTTSIALGRWHTCAVNADTTISCWGWSGHGRLGNGTGASFSGGNLPIPAPVITAVDGPPFQGAASVAAGGVTCAITVDRHVWCWGDSHYGQTGTGAGATVPVEVTTRDGTVIDDAVELVAAHTHACARRMNGELLCWGRNLGGELGDGTFLNRGYATPYRSSCP